MSLLTLFRVAAVTPELHLGDPKSNANETSKLIDELVTSGCHLGVFPEMNLTGYTCGDLFFQKNLRDASIEALQTVVECTKGQPVALTVGMPLEVQNRLFNVAVVIQDGTILGVVPKTFLPNYSEFYDQRQFAGARDTSEKYCRILGQVVPFGTDLVFQVKDTNVKWGIEICEDLWAVTPPSNNLALNGALVICNLSASNELVGKASYRTELVRQQSGRLIAAYVYASAGPGESTSDTVFSGHAIIAENDKVLKENTRFQFESQIIMADIAIDELVTERIRNSTFSEQQATAQVRIIEYKDFSGKSINKSMCRELTATSDFDLLRYINPTPFVPGSSVDRDSVCKEIIDIQSTALARRLRGLNNAKLVVGISGGLDSTHALLVAVATMDKLKRPHTDIWGITMPGLGTSSRTKNNATALMEGLAITHEEISIKGIVMQHLKDIGHPCRVLESHEPNAFNSNAAFENAQARERTKILFDKANLIHGIVLGTGTLSEIALGWCTYGGDSISSYHVNAGVPKTLVRYLINWFAHHPNFAKVSTVLEDVFNTPISPELLPTDAKGILQQETEKTIGPYELHDFFLYWSIRKQVAPVNALFYARKAFAGKYNDETLRKWAYNFYKRFLNNQFKRNMMPDGVKVGTIALSPRADFRAPSDVISRLWLSELA